MSQLPIPPKILRTLMIAGCCFVGSHAWALDASPAVQTLIKKSKANLVFVKGGMFQMGDFGPKTTPDKMPYVPSYGYGDPLHEVELDSFSISKYKVTYEDYDVYSEAEGKPRIATLSLDRRYRKTPNIPAGVNWQEAKDYCVWLGKVSGLPYGLPTEAQWEYAARNRGKFTPYATDNGKYEEGRNVASYDQVHEMTKGVTSPHVYPIGKFPANPLGLYDMASNGTDWVNDWFSKDYYEHSPKKNPQGPESGTEKVVRGIESDYVTALAMYRQKQSPQMKPSTLDDGTVISDRYASNGFRCVVNSTTKVTP
ncbi:SUMF1/EgtB/PvdO family nonheme iron enzyme [Ralstonia pseudosolanacearum]|uniref:formylglycine-generating enzyme family protein n=1 Tax=Ralstonia pseudosolanacearum TaxID=1310165 RepID=UPI002674D53C|nr:SUMF1/EgtB/PvdO family nonheme iron enzyme [Ralstonia pseudosolanacearum]MDO3624349.1 SUMF1/EgtB/PvdO family nonheme iron enzyme [Ralstonia pseudosolanacearum]